MNEPNWCKIFPHRYYINLDCRKDRREHFESEMKRLEFTAERISGVVPTDKGNYESTGDRGCTESHNIIVKLAKQNNWPNVMIFEDDACFAKDFNDRMDAAIKELDKQEWDLFYCYRHWGNIRHKLKLIQKVLGTYETHAYVIRNSVYDKILENDSKLIDHLLMEMEGVNKYTTIVSIASQINGYSDRTQTLYKGIKLKC